MMDYLIDVLSLLLSAFTAWIAWKALGTWKDELKFKAIEQLDDAYKTYLQSYSNYSMKCYELLRNDQSLENCPYDIEEWKIFRDAELEYQNSWRKIKPYVKPDEYNNFKFTKNDLQGKLRELSPHRGGECQADGYYQLIQNKNFDQIMSNLLNDGFNAIDRLN